MPPKKDQKQEEEQVSMTQVQEYLQQQKEMFLALLQQQQELFQGFVKVIMETANTRVDVLSKDIQELKTSLMFTQSQVDEMKQALAKQTNQTDSVQQDMMKVCDSLLTITDKMENLDGQIKKNNLIIDGVEETENETWSETEKKVKLIFTDKLKLHGDIDMENVHRKGRRVEGTRPRSILVKFQKYKDKLMILQKAKYLKGTKIYINEDYTEEVLRKRRELLPKMREAREKGHIAFLRHDKLIIHPRTSTPTKS